MMAMELSTRSRQAEEGRAEALVMQAQVVGRGPMLVLVGGGLTGWASWAPHADRLAATRTVTRLQLLSVEFGLEDRPLLDDYSVGMESRAMAAAIEALGTTGSLDLVAWSYGALIALDYALDFPERIRSLTLIEPPAVWVLPDRGRGDPGVEALVDLARVISDEVTERELEIFVRAAALVPPGVEPRELPQWPIWLEHRRSLRNGLAPLDHRDDTSRLRSFERPVLLVTGTGTSPFLRRIHDTLATSLPGARTIEMPAGHAPQLVSMDQFLTELASFHDLVGEGQPARPDRRGGP